MTYGFSVADWPTQAEEIGAYDLPAPARGAGGLDFTRPFLPEALARTAALTFLSPDERRRLNQIRGHAALTVLPLMDGLARGRAPAQFAQPDLRIAVLREAFAARFGAPCQVIDPVAAAASLDGAPRLARALLGLHRLCMARRHVQAAALNARTLDPSFRRLFLDRWLDTAHSAGDGLGHAMAEEPPPEVITEAVAGYRQLCHGLMETLQAQAVLDLAALETACGRRLAAEHREQALCVQHHAYWWSYIGCGLTHPRFAQAVRQLQPGAFAEFDPLIAAFG